MSSPPPLYVIALGGNAISPPRGDLTFAVERHLIEQAASELAALAGAGARLLVVHGNGPQVGRLLIAESAGDASDLDVLVAQTQGELGYLLAGALDAHLGPGRCVAVVTRVIVEADDAAFAHPEKPIGPVLPQPPAGTPSVRVPDGTGWRRVVASPRPIAVVELEAIRALLAATHVIAGGGGGVAVSGAARTHHPPAVVDKDLTATLLALRLGAERLLYVTDVPHVCEDFGQPGQRRIAAMTAATARARLASGAFPSGSMGPKIASAAAFVEASGRPAVITSLGEVAGALRGEVGTTITP